MSPQGSCEQSEQRGVTMDVDPSTTAVVLIEYQNDFTSEGGALHGAVSSVMEKTDMLAKTQEVVTAARRPGAGGMKAPNHLRGRYNGNRSHPPRILKRAV